MLGFDIVGGFREFDDIPVDVSHSVVLERESIFSADYSQGRVCDFPVESIKLLAASSRFFLLSGLG